MVPVVITCIEYEFSLFRFCFVKIKTLYSIVERNPVVIQLHIYDISETQYCWGTKRHVWKLLTYEGWPWLAAKSCLRSSIILLQQDGGRESKEQKQENLCVEIQAV